MPINFFQAACKTKSSKKQFGLCDNPSPAEDPAYIDEIDTSKWIAEVKNSNELAVIFFAIDHCSGVEPLRPNGEKAKRCDGILSYDGNLIFVELIDRGYSGWISGGRKQLTETIILFKANHDITTYSKINARICNKQKPLAITSSSTEVQKLKDDTDLILTIDRTISI